MTKRFVFLSLCLGLTLQGCWVPQIVQGVQPELFPSAIPVKPSLAKLSLETKQVALATTAIASSRVAAEVFYLAGSLANHRQALENHLFYNVRSLDTFSGWQYLKPDGLYTYYNSGDGSRFKLGFIDTTGKAFADFDLMGFSTYGPKPQTAQSFPAQVKQYQLELQRFNFQDQTGLQINVNGIWPPQIPLRESFQTELSGSGLLPEHPYLENMSFKLDGNAASDHSQISGQMSFSARIEGLVYNGFGRFDAKGFVDTVFVEHNGLTILQIQRSNDSWNVLRDQQVVATAR